MHGSPSLWLAVQNLFMPGALGQLIPPHALAVPHVTAHEQASGQWTLLHAESAVQPMMQLPLLPPPHITLLHAFGAVHWTLQLVPLHVMSLQADAALHVIVHDAPGEHVMLLHASADAQVMLQRRPEGQVNELPLFPVTVQTCGLTEVSHVVHCDGHAFVSTTQ